ncbi:MAG: aldehyde dehydrogenase family protein [Salinibacterium amurskyense]
MHKFYVGGELVAGAHTHDVISPATGAAVATLAWATAEDAHEALASAHASAAQWGRMPARDRADWMGRLRDAVIGAEHELREAVRAETGKTWENTTDDFQLLIDALAFYADAVQSMDPLILPDAAGTHRHEMVREPIGVVVAFVAWNFPLLNIAYKLGPAMAAGCPIVIKPSAKTPLSAYILGRLCAEIGLPAGVVNILSGDDAVVGDALSASTIPALITLIGSNETAQHVMRVGSTSIKRYSLELGGNAPAIVFADADLDTAADVISSLKFANAGQICVAPNRVFVHEAVAPQLSELLVARAAAVRVGTGEAGEVDMGPLIDAAAANRVITLIREAEAAGAVVLSGGSTPAHTATEAFLQPTVITGVEASMRICAEEIFGPVIAIRTFGDDDDPVAWANDTDAGLSSFVFTSDAAVADAVAAGLRFGEVHINGVKYAIELPHGGIKQSGVGHDCSILALDDYLVHKRVSRPLVNAESRAI